MPSTLPNGAVIYDDIVEFDAPVPVPEEAYLPSVSPAAQLDTESYSTGTTYTTSWSSLFNGTPDGLHPAPWATNVVKGRTKKLPSYRSFVDSDGVAWTFNDKQYKFLCAEAKATFECLPKYLATKTIEALFSNYDEDTGSSKPKEMDMVDKILLGIE